MLNETRLAVKTTKLVFGSPHAILNKHRHIFRRLKKQFKMLLRRRKSLYRALVITRYEQRSFVVEFLRQYMYFSRTLSRLSWLQWTLDDSKLSLTSRIFQTTVLFLSAQFLHKILVKSEPSLLHWIYISFPVINSRFKQALVFFGHPISSIFI